MQGLPYSYRFYDSIFSMVNVRYKVLKDYDYKDKLKEHDEGGHDHGKKDDDVGHDHKSHG